MDILIYIGAGTTLLGLIGLMLFIKRSAALKAETDQAKAKAAMQGLIALNVGALSVCFLGLMMVVIGLLL